MTAQEIYVKVTGNEMPTNQIALNDWQIKYVKWLEGVALDDIFIHKNLAKKELPLNSFDYDELKAIKTDCFLVLNNIDLNGNQKQIRDSVIGKIESVIQESQKLWYEYEIFFKSEAFDFCKIDGWFPIATNKIKNIEKIEEYIKSGLLRRVSSNNIRKLQECPKCKIVPAKGGGCVNHSDCPYK